MNPYEYALQLKKTHGNDKALKVAEECAKYSKDLLGNEDVPPLADEAEMYEEFSKDKDGKPRRIEKFRVKRNVQNRRLVKTNKFWMNVVAVLRKLEMKKAS